MGVYSLSKSGINNWSKFSNVAAGNGQTSDMELISSQFITSSVTSVTFANLQNYNQYKHLQIRFVAVNSVDVCRIRLNGDAGTNYSVHYLRGNGSTAASANTPSTNQFQLSSILASNNTYASIVDLLDPFSTTKNKTAKTLTADSNQGIELISGAWYSTAAVTSIEISAFSGTINSTSRFSLYGVK